MLPSSPILLTTGQWDQLRANHQQASIDPVFDPVPVVRLFQPEAAGVWLLTTLEPDGDRAFGLCDTGRGAPELGFVSLTDLSGRRAELRLRVERDCRFVPQRPLSAYIAAARTAGRILV